MLWRAGHETGTFREWDGVWNSGAHYESVDCTFARTGSCSANATIGSSGGIRLTYQGRNIADGQYDPENLPNDAYYSAWYYIPAVHDVSWLNIFQWKFRYEGGASREQVWITVHDYSGQSEYRPRLSTRWQTNGTWGGDSRVLATTNQTLPVGEWFQIESRYIWSSTGNGRVTTWLDGQLLWDVGGLHTQGDWDFGHWGREWAANNYGAGIDPSPFTIWIDDAVVSTTRVGG